MSLARRACATPVVLALLAAGGCGGAAGSGSTTAARRTTTPAETDVAAPRSSHVTPAQARLDAPRSSAAKGGERFSWLRARPPAAGWRLARAASGATVAYPPRWQVIAGDRGSVSAALLDSHSHYLGYLNLTPRQGGERRSDWTSFRVRHNRAEGNSEVHVLASAQTLRLGASKAACLQDAYTTSTGARYVEIACLIDGTHPSVLVGAAPPSDWPAQSATIEREISTVRV
jgi:hypothetical protein